MSDVLDTLITPETFLDVLDLDEAAEVLTDPTGRAALYGLVVEFLVDAGAAQPVSGPPDASGLDFRLMRSSVHVRLGKPTATELQTFATLAALVFGADIDPESLSAGLVVSLQQRLARTDPSVGERSIVDAVLEHKRPTVHEIVVRLHDKPCRHPTSKCRYLRGQACGLDVAAAESVVADLVAKGILRQLTSAAPAAYRVAI